MTKKLFHFEIGFPKGLNTRLGTLKLYYTKHAFRAARNDRYGRILLPDTLNTDKAKAIEVELTGRYVTKIVYRVGYNKNHDLVLVVGENNRVYTVWLNEKYDTHKTLDRTKYDRP